MRRAALLAVLLLAACTLPPVIADLDSDHVWVETNGNPWPVVDAKAAEACAMYGKQRTGRLHERNFGAFGEHLEALYACR